MGAVGPCEWKKLVYSISKVLLRLEGGLGFAITSLGFEP